MKENFVRISSTGDVVLTPEGREKLSPTPVAPPVGYVRQPSLAETIRNMVRSERLAQEAAAAGYETFEEADDFEVDDDFDPGHPFEAEFETPRAREIRLAAEQAEVASDEAGDPPTDGPELSKRSAKRSPAPKSEALEEPQED